MVNLCFSTFVVDSHTNHLPLDCPTWSCLSANRVVITAAHCIAEKKENKEHIVYAGIVNLHDFVNPGATFQAIKVNFTLRHQEFNNSYNDVGLLWLSHPFKFHSKILRFFMVLLCVTQCICYVIS